MPRWRVDIIRRGAEHLDTVEVPNAQEAILEAIKIFEIPPERQNRSRHPPSNTHFFTFLEFVTFQRALAD